MKKMKTSKGKTYAAHYMVTMASAPDKLVISLEDERALSKIAAEMEGCESISATDDNAPGRTELYDGFMQLDAIARMETGAVRVTLRKA